MRIEKEIRNCVINAVDIFQDRMLVPSIELKGESWGVCFGGYTGMEKSLGQFLMKLFATLEVNSFNRLKGVSVRAVFIGNEIVGIGHIYKDQWFYPVNDLSWEN